MSTDITNLLTEGELPGNPASIQWRYWTSLFIERYCPAKGLRAKTIRAYLDAINNFRSFVENNLQGKRPDELRTRDIIEHISHLREKRNNGKSALNTRIATLKSFFKAVVAFEEIRPEDNPMLGVFAVRGLPRKVPRTCSHEEIANLFKTCDRSTLVGTRDRAIFSLLYGTGIRASECAELTENSIDLGNNLIQVVGKGGHERVIPLSPAVKSALLDYRTMRGEITPSTPFFRSMRGKGMSRNAIYERVRSGGIRANLPKRLSPHKLRHTFASHLIENGTNLNTVRVLLGHSQLTSTQIYVHVAGKELQQVANQHPIGRLVENVAARLPGVKLPFRLPTKKPG